MAAKLRKYPAAIRTRTRRTAGRAHKDRRRLALVAGVVILVLCLLSVLIQLVYPSDRTLPGTTIGGKLLIYKNNGEVQDALQKLSQQKFDIVLGSKIYSVAPTDAGFYYADTATVQKVQDYPFQQRLIPFSIYFQHKGTIQRRLKPTIDQAKLKSFSEKLVSSSATQPVEGVVTVKNGQVTAHAPKPGFSFKAGDIERSLQSMSADIPKRVEVKGAQAPPLYDEAAVNAAAQQAMSLIRPVTVTINSNTYNLPASEVGSWLAFTRDPANRKIDVSFDKALVAKGLSGIAAKVYKAPGTTKVALTDGVETSRQAGPTGVFLDTSASANEIISILNKKSSDVNLSTSIAQPNTVYDRSYTASQAGLQALLDYLVSSKGDYGITIREIGGRGWSASSGGGKSYVTASTYKLFVAYSILKRIDSGEYHWGDSTYNTDMATCFNRMIINSDNPCAEAMGKRIGWNVIINEMHSLGLSSTIHSDTFHSTPNDEALLVGKLARGEILSGSSRNLLISLMEQQHYRLGIPAGTGVLVADKVGFLSGYLHDAAIVYGPTATYVLVIMTNNSSWSQIADTAHQIQAQMSR